MKIILREITSPSNDMYKLWKSLLSSKGIKNESSFLLSGEKLVRETLALLPLHEKSATFERKKEESFKNSSLPFQSLGLLFPQGTSEAEVRTWLPQNSEKNESTFSCWNLSQPLIKELDVLGTQGPLLWMKAPQLPTWNPSIPAEGLEILCPIGDPKNLGALLRSAEAFGANKVILLQESAHPFLPWSIKSSSGSCLRIPIMKGPSVRELGDMDIYGLDMKGDSVAGFSWPQNLRLLLGEEGPGLPWKLRKDRTLSIPTVGVESLNVTVAASIAMWEYRKSMPAFAQSL